MSNDKDTSLHYSQTENNSGSVSSNSGNVKSDYNDKSVSGYGSTVYTQDAISATSEEKDYQFSESEAYTPSYGFQTPYFDTRNAQSAMNADGTPIFVSTKGFNAQDKPEYGINWNEWSYPAWHNVTGPRGPVSIDRIAEIFGCFRQKFGFQKDNMFNMFDHLMTQLDSRASRMGCDLSLITLHADYIGGINANYRRWYLASQMDMHDEVGWDNIDQYGRVSEQKKQKIIENLLENQKQNKESKNNDDSSINYLKKHKTPTLDDNLDFGLANAEYRWKQRMLRLTNDERISQIVLYLLCWGEANQVRFMPECLCFIYKSCWDYWKYGSNNQDLEDAKEGHFLDAVITPLYRFCRDQVYERVDDGGFVHKERDHHKIIGYDDMNQLFWYREGLLRLQTPEKRRLMDIPKEERYHALKGIQWNKAFYKTYTENRTWWHICVNFHRIWIIHLSVFWFYTAFNSPTLYTEGYEYMINNQPPAHIRWSIVALGGAIGPLINIFAIIGELKFVPRKYSGSRPIASRILFLLACLCLLVAPTVYNFFFTSREDEDDVGLVFAAIQMTCAIISTLFFSFIPLSYMFGEYTTHSGTERRYLATHFFAVYFPNLMKNDRMISVGMWIGVFVAKFTESYFFLTLSLRDPVRELSVVDLEGCVGDTYLGTFLCRRQTYVLLILMYVTDLILFFLDTYLWYIIFNTLFSVFRSFYLGSSIWTPWKNIYSRLPKRIYEKILYVHERSSFKYKPKHYVAQVWNSIIAGMYSEHLLPAESVHLLLYRNEVSDNGEQSLNEPRFFVSREENSSRTPYFEPQTEAERRISFFAQSLCTPIGKACPVDAMPTFTVLIPHYGEKIMLTLREIIREDNPFTKVTLLEYLKQLQPSEWEHFVRDSKGIAKHRNDIGGTVCSRSRSAQSTDTTTADEEDDGPESKYSDVPFYCVGFKQCTPEFTLRTRIWASLRTQTLYRTISGFMNYSRAIRLLYSVEQFSGLPENVNQDKSIDFELDLQARRKFHLIAAVQRLSKFNDEENHAKELLLHAYPDMKIAYLIEEPSPIPGEEPIFYSALIDGSCQVLQDGSRKPRYKIRLSGNPILGDGKSDNQNHAIIFYRGEYIQLVDANQDHYLEECIKIRSVLAEFEEMKAPKHPYGQPSGPPRDTGSRPRPSPRAPVAIIGAREYIFSENIGVLGDVAAGKEQTFGTLFARTLAKIGGKLHYGHPDFLNGIFMTTRGGVSKAQKGLHLNEDIYAGMNAVMRGGQIKHCEYMQCGKGRDMGFGSILNFTTKIGAGMGEQMLSREYFYLGTHLTLDRFLSFYYAHPGFHINNMFISISLSLFLYVCINMSVLVRDSTICEYDRHAPITNLHHPLGCNNLIPVIEWLERCVLSIFVVFFISFFPLFVQEMTERGIWRSLTRLSRHFASLSPLFEIFVCQIYAQSLVHDLAVGGAKYISTGRGFATTRISFSLLYTRFAQQSIYFGAFSLMVLLFTSFTMWRICLLWFWLTSVALTFAPYIYNPHQFSFYEFFLDYRELIHWFFRGNTKWHKSSWVGYTRRLRTSLTGFKKLPSIGEASEADAKDVKRPLFFNLLISKVIGPLMAMVFTVIPYLFSNSQNDIRGVRPTNSLLRLGICAFGPVLVNTVILLIQFVLSCTAGPLLSLCCKNTASTIATIIHVICVVIHLIFFNIMVFMENWDFTRGLLGFLAGISVQIFVFKLLTVLFLSREFKHDHSNRVWWSGKWLKADLGWHIITQPLRELLCKIMEMSHFTMDFTLCHFILFLQIPIIIIPYIDRWHTLMLFWLLPSRQIRRPLFSSQQKVIRSRIVTRYSIIFFLVLLLYISLLLGPSISYKYIPFNLEKMADSLIPGIIQPTGPEYGSLGIRIS